MNTSGLWRGILHNRFGTFKFINVQLIAATSSATPTTASYQHLHQFSQNRERFRHLQLQQQQQQRHRHFNHQNTRHHTSPPTVEQLLRSLNLEVCTTKYFYLFFQQNFIFLFNF